MAEDVAISPGMEMCKLTKTDSAVLSWFLETEYVNAVMARGYAVAPRLDIPAAGP